MMQILYVGSGFCSAESLADILPKHLLDAGVKVDVVIPHIDGIDEGASLLAERLIHGDVHFDGRRFAVRILEGRRDGHIRAFYLDHKELKQGLSLTHDSGIRAAGIFAHAVCQWIIQSATPYDIIHCDGLETCLVPLLMRTAYAKEARISRTKAVQFVKSIEDKGKIALDYVARLGLPQSLATSEGVEFYGKMSVLKGAYLFADALLFPNDTVVKHVAQKGKDIGMEGVLFNRANRLYVLPIGIDTKRCDPESGPLAGFNKTNLAPKAQFKAEFVRKHKLNKDSQRPLICFIGHLNQSSGIDLLNDILDDLMDRRVNLVVCGCGEEAYSSAIEGWTQEFKSSIAFINEDLCSAQKELCKSNVREILSASDIVLLPASGESLDTLYLTSMRFGCIPVARKQGCAAGIHGVHNLDAIHDTDNGFTFAQYDSDAFFDATMDAVDLFAKKDLWQKLVSQALDSITSLTQTAKACIDIYQSLKA
ncbi:MAG: glycogen/starch synthase [Proteobacteria bacterium]|nr:glycogen/starch synthase [Pseudomonadota bacterium]